MERAVFHASRVAAVPEVRFAAEAKLPSRYGDFRVLAFECATDGQDYGVVGAVNNLAARLCACASAGQVLVSKRVHSRIESRVVSEAVETVIEGHYADQIAELAQRDPELAAELTQFRDEELAHRDQAVEEGAREAPGYRLLSAVIGAGCRVAIKISEKV